MSLRIQPRNEQVFSLFSRAGSNVVQSASLLPRRTEHGAAMTEHPLMPPTFLFALDCHPQGTGPAPFVTSGRHPFRVVRRPVA
jgi:hypothetical protein